MKNILSAFIAMLVYILVGINATETYNVSTFQPRSADTCADPSLAVTYIEIYDPSLAAHALSCRPVFISIDAAQDAWNFEGEVFLAWATPQNFTNALWQFHDTATGSDYLYALSTDGSVPSVPGFTADAILAYVYATQVCGSVPLLGAFNQAAGDHYYTTIANEHNILISSTAWVDAGIVAYVLPLSTINMPDMGD